MKLLSRAAGTEDNRVPDDPMACHKLTVLLMHGLAPIG
jgi:hypothetical protein